MVISLFFSTKKVIFIVITKQTMAQKIINLRSIKTKKNQVLFPKFFIENMKLKISKLIW